MSGSNYKPLTKRHHHRSNGRGAQSTAHCQGDQRKHVTMGKHAAVSPRPSDAHHHKTPFIWPYNQPPTFSGAKYWVNRHQRDFRTFAHLLELYPNLLLSEGLDPLREYMVLPENLPSHFANATTLNPSHFYNNQASSEEPSQPGNSMNTRFVYICDNTSETDFGVSSTKDKLVAALSSYCCVRTSPEQLGSYSDCIDIVEIITAADAFVFLMNSRTLNSWFSLHQLGLAIAHDIPVIAVREAGFKLPPVFPPEFHHLEIVKPNTTRAATPRPSPRHRSKSSDANRRTDAAEKGINNNNDPFSDSELLKRAKQAENAPLLLADVISGLYRTSLLYVWHLHDSCIAKLFGRLSDFLGESFLDLEISQSHSQTDNNAENLLNVGPDPNHLIVGSTSPFRPLPSQQNHLSVSDLHTEGKDNASRSTIGSRGATVGGTTTHDKSRSSTTSPAETVIKLPPIPTITGVSISPLPSRHSTASVSSMKSSVSSVRTSSRSSAKSPMTTLPKVTGDNMPDTFMNLSPPSSPFIETRYVVFPTDPGGPKRPPYVVCFPNDVFNEEENMKKEIDIDSDDEYKPPDDTENDFNKIRLDVSSEQDVSDRSPFTSPTPRNKSGKRIAKDNKESGGKGDKLKSEATNDTKPKIINVSNNKQFIKPKPKCNATNGHQNKTKQQQQDKQNDKDKKTMKMSRVELKYSSDGKPLM